MLVLNLVEMFVFVLKISSESCRTIQMFSPASSVNIVVIGVEVVTQAFGSYNDSG